MSTETGHSDHTNLDKFFFMCECVFAVRVDGFYLQKFICCTCTQCTCVYHRIRYDWMVDMLCSIHNELFIIKD